MEILKNKEQKDSNKNKKDDESIDYTRFPSLAPGKKATIIPFKQREIPANKAEEAIYEYPLRFFQVTTEEDYLTVTVLYEKDGKAEFGSYCFSYDPNEDAEGEKFSEIVEYTDEPIGIVCINQDGEAEKIIVPRTIMFKA
ncbi:hypothetical protein PP175_27805 (plasmid) [Aneurinibacillus sp. Ricciae_BoGa-3]|uniref:hypothetical protein n=1 Tax=Aneurinibacillus sp. Ricciae_BoGa-3 TaxID=3022697 RepID=UPI00234070B0|nr:hypothetical protein [Aneurinibacillus sp. Ricciae_BoGa-3]WCK56998.1 hypothetical protein PP175_27805 [Aneurinibacillus sp. Ricciae_BoGa-3]